MCNIQEEFSRPTFIPTIYINTYIIHAHMYWSRQKAMSSSHWTTAISPSIFPSPFLALLYGIVHSRTEIYSILDTSPLPSKKIDGATIAGTTLR